MRGPHQEGDFSYPVKYGYAVVGRVAEGADNLRGRLVFALHPHQTAFWLPDDQVVVVPDAVPPERAVMAANMETALNAVWDSGAGPADRIAVVGGGVVGLLTGSIAARLPGTEVTLVDVDPERAGVAERLGMRFCGPGDAPTGCDVVLHASGHPAGLQSAIDLAGTEATIVEMSWYGSKEVPLQLGGAFDVGLILNTVLES